MKVLILNRSQVHELLPMRECIDLMESALRELAQDGVVLPLRQAVFVPDRSGLLGLMPAISMNRKVMAAKIISVFPQNKQRGLESHQGVVLLFDATDGRMLSIADAGSITAIRTAAVSGLATRLLARPDASRLAILGSGLQARVHLEAMLAARNITEVHVWSRSANNADEFARAESDHLRIPVKAARTAQEAVANADVICTVTSSTTPVLHGEWIAPGAHINAVGACTPNARELDSRAIANARLFVDRRESTLKESGDFLIPKQEGFITDAHILGEIGDLLLNRCAGRTSPTEITLFKSLGIAIEDLASAGFLYDRATATGGGTWLDLEE